MSFRLAVPGAVRAFCLIVTTLVVVALVGTTASAAPAPIKLGAVVTEGASVGFPTSTSKTLKGFFQDYNAQGGFRGRKITIDIVNDGFNAETNVAGTKRLIDEGVVALVGSEAILNCLGNANLLQQANLYSLGFGPQATCYSLKQWGPVTPSVHTQVALTAQYAKEHIGGKVCQIAFNLPGADVLWKRAAQMLAKLGTKFAYANTGLTPTTNPTAALLEAKSAGCRSVVVNLTPAQNIQIANAKKTQGISNMDLILVTGYDYSTLKVLGKNAEGGYFFSYLYPFSQNDSRSKLYRRFCNKHNISPDVFSEIAYVSSRLLVKALGSIKGSVTRQSVGAAIARLNTTDSLLPGKRFKFGGQGTGGAPIVGGYIIQVKNGKFVLAPKAEVLLPRSVRSLGGKI